MSFFDYEDSGRMIFTFPVSEILETIFFFLYPSILSEIIKLCNFFLFTTFTMSDSMIRDLFEKIIILVIKKNISVKRKLFDCVKTMTIIVPTMSCTMWIL